MQKIQSPEVSAKSTAPVLRKNRALRKLTENAVGSPYGEVSILKGGILYLFAGLAYS
jgi:hypothetical protein